MKYKILRYFFSPAKVLFTKLKDKYDFKKTRFVIYGAGEIGREFLQLSADELDVTLIIDRNAEKYPYELYGIEVKGKEALKNVEKSTVVAVASEKFIADIKAGIANVNSELEVVTL